MEASGVVRRNRDVVLVADKFVGDLFVQHLRAQSEGVKLPRHHNCRDNSCNNGGKGAMGGLPALAEPAIPATTADNPTLTPFPSTHNHDPTRS